MASEQFFRERGDIDRLRYLYSLSPQSKRKEDAEEALVFWRRSLSDFGKSQLKESLGFKLEEALRAFTVSFLNEHWGSNEELIPAYLDQVVESLVREKKLVTKSSLSRDSGADNAAVTFLQGWGQWAGKILSPSKQAANTSSSSSSSADETVYYSADLLDSLSRFIVQSESIRQRGNIVLFSEPTPAKLQDNSHSLHPFLRSLAASDRGEEVGQLLKRLSDEDLDILKLHLIQKGIGREVSDENGVSFIKLGKGNDAASPLDMSQLQLKSCQSNLENRIALCQMRVDECNAKAREYKLVYNNETMSLNMLRRRERAAREMASLTQTLSTIDMAIDQLSHAQTQAELNSIVANAFIQGAQGLRSISECTNGLTPESAEAARAAFEDELDKANEVGSIINSSLDNNTQDDELLLSQFEAEFASKATLSDDLVMAESLPAPIPASRSISLQNTLTSSPSRPLPS